MKNIFLPLVIVLFLCFCTKPQDLAPVNPERIWYVELTSTTFLDSIYFKVTRENETIKEDVFYDVDRYFRYEITGGDHLYGLTSDSNPGNYVVRYKLLNEYGGFNQDDNYICNATCAFTITYNN